MNIKVLGGGCNKCETLLANAKEAVANAVVEAEVEYITDFAVIAGYGIMSFVATKYIKCWCKLYQQKI